jgi:hypothetical protein
VRRAVLGPVLAALTTGLLFASPAAATSASASGAAGDTGGGSAALARLGAVTASRADVGSCVTLTGGGFAPVAEISVSDGKQQVRTVKSGTNGAIAAGVCFNGNARPGVHVLSATGPQRGGGSRMVTSDVFVVGGSSVARASHHNTGAGHTRAWSIVAVALLVGVPLLVLVITLTMLLRAGGRLRSRRRLRRQAEDASLVFDSNDDGKRRPRGRAAVIPMFAGLAVAVLLSVAYGAARVNDLVHQVQRASDDLSVAVRHLQHGESQDAAVSAQRAVDAAAAARHDETDPVVRVLSRLPGLRPLADALRVERRVTSSAAVAVGAAPADQESQASTDLATLGRVDDTGWSTIDDRADTLRGALRALGTQAGARVAGDDLRAPMLSDGRRYLLVVQDDREARATGGVVTAHALLTAGAHSLSLGSASPAGRPWQAINLTPDFPTVAQTALELWRHEGGRGSIDGVVAVDDVALSRLGADPTAGPVDQLRAAFDTLRAATRTPVGFNAAIVSAGSGGHVQLWSAHPDEQRQLAGLTVGGALSGRPANSFEVVTQSVDGGAGAGAGAGADAGAGAGGPADGEAGSLRRDVAYSWRPTLRRDDVGAGLQLMNEAGVDVRLTNEAATPQLTWVLLYLPRGSGFLRATVDGTAVTLHSDQEQGMSVISTLVTVPGNGSTLLSVSLVAPTPDGGPPVNVRQPRIVPDEVAVTRV